eukprot:4534222-Pleurochrysis_carterae.AAC.1
MDVNHSISKLSAIQNRAFANASMDQASLRIPDGVASIGKEAFMGCTGLTGMVHVPGSTSLVKDTAGVSG